MKLPPELTSFDYEFLTNTWEGVKGAAYWACYEYCTGSGLVDRAGRLTDLGERAIHRYQAAKAGRIDVV